MRALMITYGFFLFASSYPGMPGSVDVEAAGDEAFVETMEECAVHFLEAAARWVWGE